VPITVGIMRQALIHLLVFLWIAAGVTVAVSFMINGGWTQTTPVWWWILTSAVVVSGMALFGAGRRERIASASLFSWFRELPPILRPFGAWATLNAILFLGIVLPLLIVAFLVWGNAAGRVIGAGLLIVWLLLCDSEVRRGRTRRA
jgi:hypothetical protein